MEVIAAGGNITKYAYLFGGLAGGFAFLLLSSIFIYGLIKLMTMLIFGH